MLSGHEERTWEDIRRHYEADAEEPALHGRSVAGERGDAPGVPDLPAAVAGGFWATIFLVLLGAPGAGLVIGGITALGWVLWCWWVRLQPPDEEPASPVRDPGR